MRRWHRIEIVTGLNVLTVFGVFAQTPNHPLPLLINSSDDLIDVGFAKFASLPNIGG